MKLYLLLLFCALASGEPDPWDRKHLLYKPALNALFATLPSIRKMLSLSDNDDIKLLYVYRDWMDKPVSYRVHYNVIDRETKKVIKEHYSTVIETKLDSNGKVVYYLYGHWSFIRFICNPTFSIKCPFYEQFYSQTTS